MPRMKFEIIGTETLFQGYFRVDRLAIRHERFDGSWSETYTREVFDRGHVAAVLPYDPARDVVVLNRQFRPALLDGPNEDPWLYEIVAGVIDENEAPEATAHREAVEEAGCKILDLHPIATYYSTPGVLSERVSLFIGHADTGNMPPRAVHGLPEENEDIEVTLHSADTALQLMAEGKIRNGLTIISLQWLALNRKMIRERWLVSQVGTPLI